MKPKRLAIALLCLTVLLSGSFACALGRIVEKVSPTPEKTATATLFSVHPFIETAYDIGEVVQAGDHTIVLNRVEFQDSRLTANFTVKNEGAVDLFISPMRDFSARDGDGTEFDLNFQDCNPQLFRNIMPGDQLTGNVCWNGITTDRVRISYWGGSAGAGLIVWVVDR